MHYSSILETCCGTGEDAQLHMYAPISYVYLGWTCQDNSDRRMRLVEFWYLHPLLLFSLLFQRCQLWLGWETQKFTPPRCTSWGEGRPMGRFGWSRNYQRVVMSKWQSTTIHGLERRWAFTNWLNKFLQEHWAFSYNTIHVFYSVILCVILCTTVTCSPTTRCPALPWQDIVVTVLQFTIKAACLCWNSKTLNEKVSIAIVYAMGLIKWFGTIYIYRTVICIFFKIICTVRFDWCSVIPVLYGTVARHWRQATQYPL